MKTICTMVLAAALMATVTVAQALPLPGQVYNDNDEGDQGNQGNGCLPGSTFDPASGLCKPTESD